MCRLRPRVQLGGSAAQAHLLAQAAPKVLVIGGPNGVGKLQLSLELAKRLNGEVINANSLRIYQGLDVGTNKVTDEEQKGELHEFASTRCCACEHMVRVTAVFACKCSIACTVHVHVQLGQNIRADGLPDGHRFEPCQH